MNTFCRFVLAPALLAGVGFFLLAQEPIQERKTGKVLLLKNGNVMEGDIEKVGTQMCIRRGTSEVWIDLDKTARLCADWDDAYAHMQTLLKMDSATERVKLARWCLLYRLNDKALQQASQALQLQPNHREAKQLVAMLERAQKEPPPKSSVPAEAAPAPVPPSPAPNMDVVAETLIHFTTRVQPILMNTCASCHATGHGGNFRLDRVADAGQKAATRQNLNMVLAYLDLERPAISPLLLKAVEVHGNGPLSPLKDRGAKPFQTMQQWIEQTIARNPQLKDYHAARKAKSSAEGKIAAESTPGAEAASAPKTTPVTPLTGSADKTAELWKRKIEADRLAQVAKVNPPRVEPTVVSQTSTALPASDPFDPAEFNQRAHPRKHSVGKTAGGSVNQIA